ncbi:two-component system chemotaxis response regulator CheB [Thermosipho japonicus]|uniref:protein-glutamate methylesterase n=1 Tax=Thermosipho japonicus TaxID=90323 RepID=A0A841GLH7_9BACT|nr:chemotaxis protein CheB [Thermosipho japonicus]MBB6062004.1 two-component system chemotaxis response regulator CheB [Thermosipho japonicus]
MEKIVIIGSAGSPNNVIKLLKINQKLNIPILLCIHFEKSAIENFANSIKKETGHEIFIVSGPKTLKSGLYIAEGGKDLVFKTNRVLMSGVYKKTKTHPSIEILLNSIEKLNDKNFHIFVLSGLGNDGANIAQSLEQKGVKFYIEKKPLFDYLPRSFLNNLKNYLHLTINEMKNIIIQINEKRRRELVK